MIIAGYEINLTKEIGHYILDASDVISKRSVRMRITSSELEELSKYIKKHTEEKNEG